jgi:Uma2 family endonuclease
MATVISPLNVLRNGYPTSDGKPMAETDWHRTQMTDTIETLDERFADEPMVYVSGNVLVYYAKGDKRRHVSPDVFVVQGVEKRQRPNYLIWEEGRGPDVVIEMTSSSTRREDQKSKLELYRDVLKVREYFLFDPLGDYLDPPLQGYRLRGGKYVKIRSRDGRLPSQVLRLHLERDGDRLRLWDPQTQTWLPTPREARDLAEQRAEEEARRANEEARRAAQQSRRADEEARRAEEEARRANEQAQRAEQAEAEVERLRAELERLRAKNEEQD